MNISILNYELHPILIFRDFNITIIELNSFFAGPGSRPKPMCFKVRNLGASTSAHFSRELSALGDSSIGTYCFRIHFN